MTLSRSSIALLREVAQAYIDDGIAYPVCPRRQHMRRAERAAQLRECRARFVAQFGYEPLRKELAIMADVSRPTVTRVLGSSRERKI